MCVCVCMRSRVRGWAHLRARVCFVTIHKVRSGRYIRSRSTAHVGKLLIKRLGPLESNPLTQSLTQAHEIGKSNDKKSMQKRSMSAPIVLHDAWCAMEGGGGRDRRAALPRCIALVDALPVHAQLSLRSRRLIFFTSPLLLNNRLRLSLSQS